MVILLDSKKHNSSEEYSLTSLKSEEKEEFKRSIHHSESSNKSRRARSRSPVPVRVSPAEEINSADVVNGEADERSLILHQQCIIQDVEMIEAGMASKSDSEVPVKMDDETVAFKPSVELGLGPRVLTSSSSTNDEQFDAGKVLFAKREQIAPTRMQITLGDSVDGEEDEGANGLRDPFVDLGEMGSEEQSEGKKPDRSSIPR